MTKPRYRWKLLCKKQPSTKGEKNHISPQWQGASLIHCAAAELTALCCLFNCCRQKPDQSVLGVCFIVVILRRQTQRQGTLNQRQTDEGNFCCARWGCAIQHWEELPTRKAIIHHRIHIFHMIKVCQVSARHKYPQTCCHLNFGALFCPRSYHFTPEYSLETKTCYRPDWGMEENLTGFWPMWTVPPVLPGNLSWLGQIIILPLLQEFMKKKLTFVFKILANIGRIFFYSIILQYKSQSDFLLTQI